MAKCDLCGGKNGDTKLHGKNVCAACTGKAQDGNCGNCSNKKTKIWTAGDGVLCANCVAVAGGFGQIHSGGGSAKGHHTSLTSQQTFGGGKK